MNPKVSVGIATYIGYGLSILGVIAAAVSAIESAFPKYGPWCLMVTAVIGSLTGLGRQLQSAAILHGEAQTGLPSAEEELASQPEIPASAYASVPDTPPPAA